MAFEKVKEFLAQHQASGPSDDDLELMEDISDSELLGDELSSDTLFEGIYNVMPAQGERERIVPPELVGPVKPPGTDTRRALNPKLFDMEAIKTRMREIVRENPAPKASFLEKQSKAAEPVLQEFLHRGALGAMLNTPEEEEARYGPLSKEGTAKVRMATDSPNMLIRAGAHGILANEDFKKKYPALARKLTGLGEAFEQSVPAFAVGRALFGKGFKAGMGADAVKTPAPIGPKKVPTVETPVQPAKQLELFDPAGDPVKALQDIKKKIKRVGKPGGSPKKLGKAVESRYKSIVEKGGGVYQGVQDGVGEAPSVMIFTDPQSNATLTVPLKSTRKDVTRKIMGARKELAAGEARKVAEAKKVTQDAADKLAREQLAEATETTRQMAEYNNLTPAQKADLRRAESRRPFTPEQREQRVQRFVNENQANERARTERDASGEAQSLQRQMDLPTEGRSPRDTELEAASRGDVPPVRGSGELTPEQRESNQRLLEGLTPRERADVQAATRGIGPDWRPYTDFGDLREAVESLPSSRGVDPNTVGGEPRGTLPAELSMALEETKTAGRQAGLEPSRLRALQGDEMEEGLRRGQGWTTSERTRKVAEQLAQQRGEDRPYGGGGLPGTVAERTTEIAGIVGRPTLPDTPGPNVTDAGRRGTIIHTAVAQIRQSGRDLGLPDEVIQRRVNDYLQRSLDEVSSGESRSLPPVRQPAPPPPGSTPRVHKIPASEERGIHGLQRRETPEPSPEASPTKAIDEALEGNKGVQAEIDKIKVSKKFEDRVKKRKEAQRLTKLKKAGETSALQKTKFLKDLGKVGKSEKAQASKKAQRVLEIQERKEAEQLSAMSKKEEFTGQKVFEQVRAEVEALGYTLRHTPGTKKYELRTPQTGEKKSFPSLDELWSYIENETGSFRPLGPDFLDKAGKVFKKLHGYTTSKALPMRAAFSTPSGRAIGRIGRETIDNVDRLQGLAIRDFLDPKILPVTKKVKGKRVNQKQFDLVGKALEDGDLYAAEYSSQELAKRGLDQDGIEAYKAVRRLSERLWKHLEAVGKKIGSTPPAYLKGHMPHRWMGSWELVVDGSKHIRPNGESSFVQRADALKEAWRLMKQDKKVEVKFTGRDILDDLPELAFLKAFKNITSSIERGSSLSVEELTKAFKKGQKPRGFAAHLAQRKGEKGYTSIAENWDKLIRSYTAAGIRYVELKKFRHDATRLAKRIDPRKNPIEDEKVIAYVRMLSGKQGASEIWINNVINAVGDPFGIQLYRPALKTAATLNTITTHLKLGLLNVTFPLVNLNQNFMTTGPLLARMVAEAGLPAGLSEKVLLQAISMYNTPAGKRIRMRLAKHGVLDPKFVRAEMGKFTFDKSGAEKISLGLSAYTEHHNRSFAALARYLIARNHQGWSYKKSYKAAKDFAEEAHFRYDLSDKPELFRGPVGGTLGIFRTFSSNMVHKMGLLAGTARRGSPGPLLRYMGAMIAMGGVAGVPGVYFANEMAGKATGYYPLDTFYEKAPKYLKYGLIGGLGVDISRRVGVGDIFPKDFGDLKGATWSTILNLLEGWRNAAGLAAGGEILEAGKEVVSTAAKEIPSLRGLEQLTTDEGTITDKKDHLVYEPTTKEKALVLTGLRPVRASEIQETKTALYHKTKRFTALRKKYIDKMVRLRAAGKHAAARSVLHEANSKHKLKLTFLLVIAEENRRKRDTGLERQFKYSPKSLKSPKLRKRVRELSESP